ncbi:MAG: CvpA family protein [Pirellulaceae bacterium]
MTTGLTIAAFVLILVGTWFLGFWNNVITFVNTVLAAIFASNYFEPLADAIDGGQSSYTYLLDFVSLWLLFFATFAILRTATDMLSKHRVHFDKWLELTGRTVFTLATAWVFVCFMQFSFHTAPFPPGEGNFQARPNSVNFAGAPDRLWLGFLQSRSTGALASTLPADYDTSQLHPSDRDSGVMVFDSKGDFIYKYHHRRLKLSQQEALRVQR